MKRMFLLLFVLLLAAVSGQGWSNVGKDQEAAGFSWTEPLFGGTWMVWTAATAAVFVAIFAAMAVMTVIEIV